MDSVAGICVSEKNTSIEKTIKELNAKGLRYCGGTKWEINTSRQNNYQIELRQIKRIETSKNENEIHRLWRFTKESESFLAWSIEKERIYKITSWEDI